MTARESGSAATYQALLEEELEHLGIATRSVAVDQLAIHFALLLVWNERMNLSAVRSPREIAQRHFAESLYLTRILPVGISPPRNMMVDVGSGAGFPGLALKAVWPQIPLILLEPNIKKSAFLKEVIRNCGYQHCLVQTRMLRDAVADLEGQVELVTMRAVLATDDVLTQIARLLMPGGMAALFMGSGQAESARQRRTLAWQNAYPIPGSHQRIILIGEKE